MTRAREQQICCEDTPYYHCISRVVRKAFLCGFDKTSQQNYEHRRQWVLDRLAYLNSAFCIDVCAYAIMSNHYHLVLYINKAEVDGLSDLQVIERWRKIYKGTDVIQRFINGEKLSKEHHELIAETVSIWRERLADISWFMRCLNEHIAHKANFEDNCKGRFWEGRFKSQALLDEQALLTCMAYVELNPIRAKMAKTPEASQFTSIKQRIEENNAARLNAERNKQSCSLVLKQFGFEERGCLLHKLPFSYQDYIDLVDWTGRAIRDDKRGSIDAQLPPILLRLGIEEESWCKLMQPKGAHRFSHAMGCCDKMRLYARKLKVSWIKGVSISRKLFPI